MAAKEAETGFSVAPKEARLSERLSNKLVGRR
jgi:hypothetical protein